MIILLFLAIVSFLQLGLLIDYYLVCGRKLELKLAPFFGLGLGFVTIFLMVLGLLEVSISRAIVFGLAAVSFIPIFADQSLRVQLAEEIRKHIKNVKAQNGIIILGFGLFLSVILMVTFSHIPWSDDAYERWIYKGGAFWHDGVVTRDVLYQSEPSDDPILWPLTSSWLYHFLGQASEFWVQVIPFGVYLAIVLEFFRRKVNLLWICILAFTPFLWGYVVSPEYVGSADLLLGFFLLLSFGALLKGEAVYGAIFLGIAALAKNDANPAILALMILFTYNFLRSKKRANLVPLLVVLAFFSFSVFWKINYDLGSRFLQKDILLSVFEKRPFIEYNFYSLQSFREEFRQVSKWGIGWYVIAFFVIVYFPRIFSQKQLMWVFLLFCAQFAGYFWVYYVNNVDQATEIATSISRLSLQIYVPALFFAYMLSVFAKKS